MSVVSYELIGEVGVLRLNNPPVNALSHALRAGIVDTIASAQNDASRALLLICEGRTFIAGADITEFGKPPQSPVLSDVLDAIEGSAKPVIAAIHGSALGGGLEVALSCHYRCALTTAKLGLPEVNLGLLPGAGGTQRTPRLVGVEAALGMITSGAPVPAAKAEAMNLVDTLIEGDDLLQGALAYAQSLIAEAAPLRRVRDIAIENTPEIQTMIAEFRTKIAKKSRGQLAPDHIVSCIQAAVELPFDEGMARERELFMELMTGPQSKAMRHMFFAEREAAKVIGLAKDTATREIKRVGVIGGGTMGGGIAMNFANVGIPVTMLEINDEALQRGLGIVDKNYSITVSKGKMSETQKTQCLGLIDGTTDYNDLSDVDLVIEAVFENLDIKKQVFTKLDAVCKQGAILASNTSYQDVDQIAAATGRPEDVIGLHFFSPANVMKLLEVVRGDKTADDVIATAMKMAKTIRKVPVLARVCYGFIGNRMLQNYFREAQLCMIEGASPEQIDSALQNWGMAMGPLAVGDLAGIDIGYKAREVLSDDEKGDPRTYRIADALVEMGRFGQKTGAGYYKYDPDTRARINDPEVTSVIEKTAAELGVERRNIDDEEILNRTMFGLINEGANILAEGIAQRPSDIDVVYVYGYGYPVHRGGPMHYGDAVGLDKVYATICEYAKRFGDEFWTPSPLLKQLAEEGKTFAEWAAEKA